MKKVKFNEYISHIGIEFEGFFSPKLNYHLEHSKVKSMVQIGEDGSLLKSLDIPYSYNVYEIRTKILDEKESNLILKFFDFLMKKGDYLINKTCGLHFHISFNSKSTYSKLFTQEFYDEYLYMFNKYYPDIFVERHNKHHCKADISPDYFNRNVLKEIKNIRHSDWRYHAINYPILRYNTVEFRLFGGSLATIELLTDCICRTFSLIKKYEKKQKILTHDFSVKLPKQELQPIYKIKKIIQPKDEKINKNLNIYKSPNINTSKTLTINLKKHFYLNSYLFQQRIYFPKNFKDSPF